MKKTMLQGKKPIKKLHKEITYKGCKISYTVSDYGLGSSGFAYIMYYANGAFTVGCIILKEPTETLKKAETEIIKRSKEWINIQLTVGAKIRK